jgi:Ca2+-binding EF-hand superfamily protein
MKRIMNGLTITALTAVFAASAPATAQLRKPDPEEVAKRFAAADKNGDGRLTREEATAGMPRVAKNFDTIDKDKKGYVTLDEIKAAMTAGRSR